MGYEAVIGLEVHVQLRTETKMFCRCPNRFGAEPNTLICPVCLGYPGALPVLNRRAVDLAVRLAVALGAEVAERSVFARKNYFYPDLPKGYQISQFERPLAVGGQVPLAQGGPRITLRRLHLEEDAGKLLHELPGGAALPDRSLVDFNRCGVPLVEIVTEPELSEPREAQDFLQTLHQLLLYTETSDGNMEEGSLRCDANVSVRRRGDRQLGVQAEVKNLNSFKNVGRALAYEIERQTQALEAGERLARETRSFDADAGVTRPLRSKEQAHDYRYFPEPDLPTLRVRPERVEALRRELPELPWERRGRFRTAYGLSDEDAAVLSSTRELADYFEAAARGHGGQGQAVANWVRTEVLRELKERKQEVAQAIPPERLADLVARVDRGEISNRAAKEVLAAIWGTDEEPDRAIDRLGLRQVSDRGRAQAWVDAVLREHGAQVAEYRAGKGKVLGFFIGQVMQRSAGRAEPQLVRELLLSALESETVREGQD